MPKGLVHQADEAVHGVVHIPKRPRLAPVAVDRDVLAMQRLQDEVAHDTTIIGVHA